MRTIILMSALLAVASMFDPSFAAQQGLAASAWSASSPQNFVASPPQDKVVLALVRKLNGVEALNLCVRPQFANLRNSGNLSLIVSTQSGTACGVQIIDKTSSGFELYDVDSSYAEAVDLGHTGTSQLIANIDLTYYEGGNHCQAVWPIVYAWNGKGYSDVSGQYKEYYQQELASLKKQIALLTSAAQQTQVPDAQTSAVQSMPTVNFQVGWVGTPGSLAAGPSPVQQEESPAASPTPSAMPDLENADCIRAEAAKIERFLSISRDAGINDAIKWANSDDPWTRVFASQVLADIGTPDARLYLRTLSRDPNPMVAGVAKDDLESGQAEQHTVDQVQLGGPASN
jgi:hypothetical protein